MLEELMVLKLSQTFRLMLVLSLALGLFFTFEAAQNFAYARGGGGGHSGGHGGHAGHGGHGRHSGGRHEQHRGRDGSLHRGFGTRPFSSGYQPSLFYYDPDSGSNYCYDPSGFYYPCSSPPLPHKYPGSN